MSLELFAKLYAASRDNGRPKTEAARRAGAAMRHVFYAGREWAVVDVFEACGHRQAVLERRDAAGHAVRRTVTLTELGGA